ncbi:MAG: hypothetical protein HOV80_00535 [Polyangiaceae bacterium]|nr:hypothetical protein [Polyangiaceae bacterium]
MRHLGLALLILVPFLGTGAAFAQETADPPPAKEPAPPSDAPPADEPDEGQKDDASKDDAKDETKPHPDPRVIIDVTSKAKKKKDKNADKNADAIQAAARRGFWGKTVGCYKLAAWSDPKLEIDVTLRVDVRGGAVKKATVQKPEAPKKKNKKKTKTKSAADEVGACLAKRAVGLAMPKGVKTATSLRVQVYPGDDPIPPPPSKSAPAKDKPKPKK